jgi:hypothetical protein
MYKEHTVKKSDISIFFRDEKIRVGMEWPNKSLKQAAKVLVQYITCNPHRAEDEGWRDATLVSLL